MRKVLEKPLEASADEYGGETISLSDPQGRIETSLVILPTYNEGESILRVLGEVQAKAPGSEILVVDDNSPDGTAAKVKQVPNFGKMIHLLERPKKAEQGFTYREVFHWALKRGYDAVVEMDADLSHDPADVPKLIQSLNDGADIAVGSRYVNGVRVLNWPLSRLWTSSFGGWYARLLTGLPMTDPTSGFKAIRRRVLEELDWDKMTARGVADQVQIYFQAWQNGFRLLEIPIVYRNQGRETAPLVPRAAGKAVWIIFKLGLKKIFP